MSKIIIVSGPVIVKNNKALLDISGEDKFWKFCGGKIKEDESLIDTAKRRAKEELGIDIDILNKEPFIMYTKKTENEKIEIVLVHFLAKSIGEVKPGEDIKEWAWHDLDNLPDNLGPNIVPALKYFDLLK